MNDRVNPVATQANKMTNMYIGQFIHSLDPKNRVFLPARFRNAKKSFILTRGLESCLYLYDLPGWEKVLQKLEELSLPDKVQERAFKRALLSGAHEAQPDSQGRVLIPQPLKEYASIRSEIIIIGVGNRLEIWDHVKWKKYYQQHAGLSFKSLAGKLEF